MKFIVFALIPLILSMGLVPALPFSDASEDNQICIDKVWIENSKGKRTRIKVKNLINIIHLM